MFKRAQICVIFCWDCEYGKEAQFSHELPRHAWNSQQASRRKICAPIYKRAVSDTQMTASDLLFVLIFWVGVLNPLKYAFKF